MDLWSRSHVGTMTLAEACDIVIYINTEYRGYDDDPVFVDDPVFSRIGSNESNLNNYGYAVLMIRKYVGLPV